MRCGMYSDRKKRRPTWLAAALLAVVLIAVCGLLTGRAAGRDISAEAAASVKEAVERAALQCYVVEGAYPSDLEYLTENYGLAVNTRDFYIHYDAFASNLPPDVRVEPKPARAER